MPDRSSSGGRPYSDEETPPPPPPKHIKQPLHGGAWKVAYADFVTAMMALFIVLWVLNQGEEVRQSVQAYFRDPVGFNKSGGQAIPALPTPAAPPTIELNIKRTEELEREIARMKELISASERLDYISD